MKCPNCQTVSDTEDHSNILHVFKCQSCQHLVIFDSQKGITSTNNWCVKVVYHALKCGIELCSSGIMHVLKVT